MQSGKLVLFMAPPAVANALIPSKAVPGGVALQRYFNEVPMQEGCEGGLQLRTDCADEITIIHVRSQVELLISRANVRGNAAI